MSVATAALVLVIPVVAAVVVGFVAGAVEVGVGFVAHVVVFIPPYYTLGIGARENYVPLGVYVAVLLLVAHVVARLRRARTAASAREERHESSSSSLSCSVETSRSRRCSRSWYVPSAATSANSVSLALHEEGRLDVVAGASGATGAPRIRRAQLCLLVLVSRRRTTV